MVVDQDYAYKDYPKLIKEAGINGFKKEKKKIINQEIIKLQI